MPSVAEVFRRPGVVAFGKAIRSRMRPDKTVGGKRVEEKDLDYATLADLESVQTPERLAEVIKSFLRRFRAYANKVRSENKGKQREERQYEPMEPTEAELLDLMAIPYEFGDPRDGTAVVRAALIAHALVRFDRRDDSSNEEDVDDE